MPLHVAQLSRAIVSLADELKGKTNPNMASDLVVANALARAAIVGAIANVEINLKEIKDEAFVRSTRQTVEAVRA